VFVSFALESANVRLLIQRTRVSQGPIAVQTARSRNLGACRVAIIENETDDVSGYHARSAPYGGFLKQGKLRALSEPKMQNSSEPTPCRKFAKRFRFNAPFLAHLPDCEACRATLRYLVSESEKRRAAVHSRPN
jgi:hypothetical protein